MSQLVEMKCTPVSKSDSPLDDAQINRYQAEVPAWNLIQVEGEQRLQRQYQFKNFAEALSYANLVGRLAEAENHHPALLVEWGKVTVTWWTHAIHGLHLNDFIMAARSDQAYTVAA
ncbi:MAG: 4a-hydroxytetrahydrobiopterin dehydratase [Chloroflexi bacterium]|nr:4a-hydroxytetrahydrobiopterin dehydratase [Chloroflexota bacterium]